MASTLSKVLAMRHDLEFNGHKPSEKDLEANLAALRTALDLDNIEEKYAELNERPERKRKEEVEKREGNQMYS